MWGIDYLAGAKYPQIVIDEHPTGWAAGIFANTFGDYQKVIVPLLATGGRCPRVRIHAVWDDNHLYRPQTHRPIIRKEIRRAQELKARFPEVEIQFSPFCELRQGGPMSEIIAFCQQVGHDGLVLVASSLDGQQVTGALTEYHREYSGPVRQSRFNFSWDGTTAFDDDVEMVGRKYRDADTMFLWSCHLNLKRKDAEKTPRPQRTYRPLGKHIDALVALHRPSGKISFPKNWILKPVAEDSGDSKSNHVVILAPINVPQMKMRDVAGNQAVGTLKNYGRYKDLINGRSYWRYYSDDWGYLIAEKALRISGDRRVVLMAEGKQIGIVNPAFRAGIFRD